MNNFFADLKLASYVIVIIFIVTLLIHLFLNSELNAAIIAEIALYNVYYGLPLCFLNGWFFEYLNKIFPWEKRPSLRALAGVFGSIVLTMMVLIILNFILWTVAWGKPISSLWLIENRSFYINSLVITGIVSISVHAITFFGEVQKEKLVSAKLRQEKLATELSALRTHVDPHFLFNSFNVLSGLIDEDRDKAQEFLGGLTKIYRYILEQRNDDTCAVADELQFAQQYLNLQRMRFENSIRLETDIKEAAMEKKVPSLSLQLLMENAIKHNGFDEENPLAIRIIADEDTLMVTNNLKTRKNLTKGNGIGLQNIKDRYALLTDRQPAIETNESSFTVKLPLI